MIANVVTPQSEPEGRANNPEASLVLAYRMPSIAPNANANDNQAIQRL